MFFSVALKRNLDVPEANGVVAGSYREDGSAAGGRMFFSASLKRISQDLGEVQHKSWGLNRAV
jgi:hypothetical protein